MEEHFMERVNIRSFSEEDLEAIVEIDRKVLGKPRWSYWKQQIELSNTRFPLSCLVAEFEGKVIGFILGEVSGGEFKVPDTVGWISTIGVDPVFQHRGVARKLSQEFIKNLKSVGVTIVYTLVNWSDWDLLKFFHAMGFSRGEEMINLELNLS
ncbi:MAG: hypothetical protein A2157_03385 [Deltaproteobacteria bacterium RBG_16_47_11]|nr:MAG: hypothetical protein A2157_03385 [Deltaproteobacteria bacterium RBG_16_47_11]